jgi:phenylalanyl-tRNA synthetase beta chain
LNGEEYLLNMDTSVISDDKNIHAIAGIIGELPCSLIGKSLG